MLYADPFETLLQLQQVIDAFRSSAWLGTSTSGAGAFPPLNLFSKGDDIVIVAEALHAYAPASANAGDLFGIGSILVTAGAQGDNTTLIYALLFLVAVIALINVFLWQPLLARAERYKFE